MKQMTFAGASFSAKKRQTRRERFLFEMEQGVPWAALLDAIRPYYPQSGRRGRQPMPLEAMLRIYLWQQWYALSDPAMEDALYEVESMRRFVGLKLIDDALPDETTILKFRHLLEAHGLTAEILNVVNAELERRGVLLKGGTRVDATIIPAPSSTKHADKARDPEMRSARKGHQWHFGLKAHVGVDLDSGLVHTVSVTDAATADITELPDLLREDDVVVLADKGYIKHAYEQAAHAAGVIWGVPEKAPRGGALTDAQKERNCKLSAWRVPDRAAMNAILFVLCTGCQWNALNASALCSSSSAHRRFIEWTEAGVFEAFWRQGLLDYDGLKGLDWSWLALDGALSKAPLAGTKKRGRTRRTAASRAASAAC